ncbi:MAG: hypothetical protein APR63_05210 [Desulfuromonas sp. SDB]|nr:MAG: hypothetical protein APR63_05210 [Desulfuromonas sp. SDB]
MGFTAVIVAGGIGTRFQSNYPKQLKLIKAKPVWQWSVSKFNLHPQCNQIIVVVPQKWKDHFVKPPLVKKDFKVIIGGDLRQDSVLAGISIAQQPWVAIHDAARPLISYNLIHELWQNTTGTDAVIPGLPLNETLKKINENYVEMTLPRESLYSVQTPQFVKKELLIQILKNSNQVYTDDAAAMESSGYRVKLIQGDPRNIKITTQQDFNMAINLLSTSSKVGMGIDFHRFIAGRKLILGGVIIPHTQGLLGHSDADVLTHAIIDALLGACGKKDIGTYFPDDDDKFKDADSLDLLAQSMEICNQPEIVNIDTVIIAEKPKLKPWIDKITYNLADKLKIDNSLISVKATSYEGLGPEGEGLGISAHALVQVITSD